MLAVGLSLAGPQVRSRFFSIEQHDTDPSSLRRLAVWQTAMQVSADHPWLGVGMRGFSEVASEYNPDLGGAVHNTFLQATVDCGIPAAVALVGAVLLSLWHLHGLRRSSRGNPFVYDLAGCLQAGLIGFVITGMFCSMGMVELTYIILAMVVGLRNVTAEEARSAALAAPAITGSPAPSASAPPASSIPAGTLPSPNFGSLPSANA